MHISSYSAREPLASEMRQNFAVPRLVPGRSCGSCSLCCKLPRIDELEKPVGTWCNHCAPGRGGCTVYDWRPQECQTFYCSWLFTPQLGPEWHPAIAKMFILQETPRHIAVYVDTGSPTAWRRAPYYDQLKTWARAGVEQGTQVVVYIKNRAIAILPNKEVDLGTYNDGDSLIVRQIMTPHGTDFEALLVHSEKGRPEQQKNGVHAGDAAAAAADVIQHRFGEFEPDAKALQAASDGTSGMSALRLIAAECCPALDSAPGHMLTHAVQH